MKRIPESLLRRMADRLSAEDRDEQAIPSYLHRNPALRWMAWRRVEVIAQRLRKSLQARNGGDPVTILDFGCGTGVLFAESSQLADRVYGVDIVLDAARMLVDEWKLDKVTLLTPAEAESAVAPKSVDVILAAEVLEHVEPLRPTMEQFRRWLKPDGLLLVTLPTENALYRFGRRLSGFSGHYHHHNAASIDAELAEFGFRRRRKQRIPVRGMPSIYWALDYAPPA
jgi:2-polyprenyl-3-methyl-5-hydroxy-6-metoxy-1,4-benzoquinol methylase